MYENIGRNDPCPCGSGKKYKKCCLKNDMVLKVREDIVECAICEREFNRNLKGTFQSKKKKRGKRIYFCPECNLNLSCSTCGEKLGTKSFGLYSCKHCGAVTVVCEDCMKKGKPPKAHH